MYPGRDYSKIVETARVHYQNLKNDILNAQNRVEHIRLSALAQEAHNLLTDLTVFEIGLVYSHTNNSDNYIEKMLENSAATAAAPAEEPLDIPEFKSPYNPDL